MNELHDLLSKCADVNQSPLITQEELAAIDEVTASIEGLEWPIIVEEAEGLDLKMEVKPEQLKGFLLSLVLKAVVKIKQKLELIDKILKKGVALKNVGIENSKEMYDNIMKDKPFLNAFAKSTTSDVVGIGKAAASGAGEAALLNVIITIAIIVILAFITGNPIKGIKVLTPVLIQIIKGNAKLALALSAAFTGVIGTAQAAGNAKKLGFKNILRDLVSLIKSFNIKDLKNKFRNYEVSDDVDLKKFKQITAK